MRLFCLILWTAAAAAQAPRIGVIDFLGRRQVPEAALRQALGVKEEEALPGSKGDVEEALEKVKGVVRARLEAICCEEGKAILYVGIEEKGAPHFEYHLPPGGGVRLPEEVHQAYAQFLAAVGRAVRAWETSEDLSRGHSLMRNPEARAAQERFVELAARHLELLRNVLRNSSDSEHRAMAAYVIGYAPRKEDVTGDLQHALRDPDDTVRSNAARALGAVAVLASRQPDLGIKISPTWFVEMLNSLVWSDRHTAAVTLVTLTEGGSPDTLALLRERALPSLAEMAAWKHLPHALPPFILIGRLAGLPEKDIQDAWSRGERQKVIRQALRRQPRNK